MSPTLLHWGTALAVALALVGLASRGTAWLRVWVGPAAERPSTRTRLLAALREMVRTVLGRGVVQLAAALAFDVLLQRRLWRRDRVRWLGHFAVFLGFLGLLLLHALDETVTERLFPGYLSTLSPWYALRDALGLGVAAGLTVGVIRRQRERGRLPKTRRRDPLFVGLVSAILATGFLLTAAKIISAPVFYRMADEYGGISGADLEALRSYWAADFGVVFTDRPVDATEATWAAGRTQHEQVCMSCHVAPQGAVVSYPVSRVLAGLAGPLADLDLARWLLHVHVLLCLLALAYLPWSRFFHVVADPLSLLAKAGPADGAVGARAVRRALALDACVRCGLCDERCSVRALAGLLHNEVVLPSAKLLAVRRAAVGRDVSGLELEGITEGTLACSDCGRCTAGCPVGLDLVDLWTSGKAMLAGRGFSAVPLWVKRVPAGVWAERLKLAALAPEGARAIPVATDLTRDRHTFSPCVQCQTCTNVCPVVEHSTGESGVDATPQKVMNLLRLGMSELALGSRMVWDCTTCYQCQEHCPAGIRVTEVLYELRNRGYDQLRRIVRPGVDVGSQGGGG